MKNKLYFPTPKLMESAISLALNESSNLGNEASRLYLEGWSSPKVRHLLNNICGGGSRINYFEVGIYKGSTFISALFGNFDIKATGVDVKITKDLKDNLVKHLSGYSNFETIESDCFELNQEKFINSVDVFFYDGLHSQKCQEKAFTVMNPIFKKRFVVIIDDWNEQKVKNGTKLGISKMGYNVIYKRSLPSSGNGDLESWWNGIYIAILEKP